MLLWCQNGHCCIPWSQEAAQGLFGVRKARVESRQIEWVYSNLCLLFMGVEPRRPILVSMAWGVGLEYDGSLCRCPAPSWPEPCSFLPASPQGHLSLLFFHLLLAPKSHPPADRETYHLVLLHCAATCALPTSLC